MKHSAVQVPWTNVLIGGGLRLGRQSIVKALKASLERMGLQSVQLYQARLDHCWTIHSLMHATQHGKKRVHCITCLEGPSDVFQSDRDVQSETELHCCRCTFLFPPLDRRSSLRVLQKVYPPPSHEASLRHVKAPSTSHVCLTYDP